MPNFNGIYDESELNNIKDPTIRDLIKSTLMFSKSLISTRHENLNMYNRDLIKTLYYLPDTMKDEDGNEINIKKYRDDLFSLIPYENLNSEANIESLLKVYSDEYYQNIIQGNQNKNPNLDLDQMEMFNYFGDNGPGKEVLISHKANTGGLPHDEEIGSLPLKLSLVNKDKIDEKGIENTSQFIKEKLSENKYLKKSNNYLFEAGDYLTSKETDNAKWDESWFKNEFKIGNKNNDYISSADNILKSNNIEEIISTLLSVNSPDALGDNFQFINKILGIAKSKTATGNEIFNKIFGELYVKYILGSKLNGDFKKGTNNLVIGDWKASGTGNVELPTEPKILDVNSMKNKNIEEILNIGSFSNLFSNEYNFSGDYLNIKKMGEDKMLDKANEDLELPIFEFEPFDFLKEIFNQFLPIGGSIVSKAIKPIFGILEKIILLNLRIYQDTNGEQKIFKTLGDIEFKSNNDLLKLINDQKQQHSLINDAGKRVYSYDDVINYLKLQESKLLMMDIIQKKKDLNRFEENYKESSFLGLTQKSISLTQEDFQEIKSGILTNNDFKNTFKIGNKEYNLTSLIKLRLDIEKEGLQKNGNNYSVGLESFKTKILKLINYIKNKDFVSVLKITGLDYLLMNLIYVITKGVNESKFYEEKWQKSLEYKDTYSEKYDNLKQFFKVGKTPIEQFMNILGNNHIDKLLRDVMNPLIGAGGAATEKYSFKQYLSRMIHYNRKKINFDVEGKEINVIDLLDNIYQDLEAGKKDAFYNYFKIISKSYLEKIDIDSFVNKLKPIIDFVQNQDLNMSNLKNSLIDVLDVLTKPETITALKQIHDEKLTIEDDKKQIVEILNNNNVINELFKLIDPTKETNIQKLLKQFFLDDDSVFRKTIEKAKNNVRSNFVENLLKDDLWNLNFDGQFDNKKLGELSNKEISYTLDWNGLEDATIDYSLHDGSKTNFDTELFEKNNLNSDLNKGGKAKTALLIGDRTAIDEKFESNKELLKFSGTASEFIDQNSDKYSKHKYLVTWKDIGIGEKHYWVIKEIKTFVFNKQENKWERFYDLSGKK